MVTNFVLISNKKYNILNLFLLFIEELENTGLMNIRRQIYKLSTDLNITKKGCEVFSGERKTILPSNTEITFGIELKKKMKELKVFFLIYVFF